MLCSGGPGFTSLDPMYRPTHCSSSHAVVVSHIQNVEEDWHRCLLSNNLPQAKRGGLPTDVSSEPIFLAHTHTQNPNNLEMTRDEISPQSGWGLGRRTIHVGGNNSVRGPHHVFVCFAFWWSSFELYLIEVASENGWVKQSCPDSIPRPFLDILLADECSPFADPVVVFGVQIQWILVGLPSLIIGASLSVYFSRTHLPYPSLWLCLHSRIQVSCLSKLSWTRWAARSWAKMAIESREHCS